MCMQILLPGMLMFDMEKYCVAAEIALLMVLKGALQGWMEAVQAGDNSWPCTSSSFLSSYRTKYLSPVLSIKPQTLPHSGTTTGIEWIPHPLWHWCIVRKTEKKYTSCIRRQREGWCRGSRREQSRWLSRMASRETRVGRSQTSPSPTG